MTKRLTTHRLLQLHNLADDLSARAGSAGRAAANLERIGNKRGAQYCRARAARYQVIATRAQERLNRDMAVTVS